MKRLYKRNIFIAVAFSLCSVACRPGEDVGLAQYFISNNSDYDIDVKCIYIKSVSVVCDSCRITNNSETKLGEDGNFGHAPHPNETIASIKVYKNDTIKLELSPSFADSLLKAEKGANEHDYNYYITIENTHLE